jgi:hypothetical protein
MGLPRMVRSRDERGYWYDVGSAAILEARSDCLRWLETSQLSSFTVGSEARGRVPVLLVLSILCEAHGDYGGSAMGAQEAQNANSIASEGVWLHLSRPCLCEHAHITGATICGGSVAGSSPSPPLDSSNAAGPRESNNACMSCTPFACCVRPKHVFTAPRNQYFDKVFWWTIS